MRSEVRKTMQAIDSVQDIIPLYDGFVIDLWGVVHDGSALYSGVRQSFAALRAAGKRVVILSNAPRRASRSIRGLQALGIGNEAYDGLVTSGEVTYRHIALHHSGQRFHFMGEEEDTDILEGIAATRTYSLEKAEFVLNVGQYHPFQPLEELHGELHAMRALSLPMLCANPDREVVKIDGTVYPCAGEIADYYAAIGGQVTYIGKPYPAVYAEAVQALGLPDGMRILAIGDNPLTDIRGGNAYGLDTLLISGGVLKPLSGSPAALQRQLEKTGDIPTYYCASFGII